MDAYPEFGEKIQPQAEPLQDEFAVVLAVSGEQYMSANPARYIEADIVTRKSTGAAALQDGALDEAIKTFTGPDSDVTDYQKREIKKWADRADTYAEFCSRYETALPWLLTVHRNPLDREPSKLRDRAVSANVVGLRRIFRHAAEKFEQIGEPTDTQHFLDLVDKAFDEEQKSSEATGMASGVGELLSNFFTEIDNPLYYKALLDQAKPDGHLLVNKSMFNNIDGNPRRQIVALKAIQNNKRRGHIKAGDVLEAQLNVIYGMLDKLMPHTIAKLESRPSVNLRTKEKRTAEMLGAMAKPIVSVLLEDEDVDGRIKERLRETKWGDVYSMSLAYETILYGLSKGYYGLDKASQDQLQDENEWRYLEPSRLLSAELTKLLFEVRRGNKILVGEFIMKMTDLGKTPEQIAALLARRM